MRWKWPKTLSWPTIQVEGRKDADMNVVSIKHAHFLWFFSSTPPIEIHYRFTTMISYVFIVFLCMAEPGHSLSYYSLRNRAPKCQDYVKCLSMTSLEAAKLTGNIRYWENSLMGGSDFFWNLKLKMRKCATFFEKSMENTLTFNCFAISLPSLSPYRYGTAAGRNIL